MLKHYATLISYSQPYVSTIHTNKSHKSSSPPKRGQSASFTQAHVPQIVTSHPLRNPVLRTYRQEACPRPIPTIPAPKPPYPHLHFRPHFPSLSPSPSLPQPPPSQSSVDSTRTNYFCLFALACISWHAVTSSWPLMIDVFFRPVPRSLEGAWLLSVACMFRGLWKGFLEIL
ncbi:hypothetical protein P154DRAFT_194515 [Amniculicola lignicola CBS 123094]|uniref:Uncharacterized protein n=1 Tax=Amniculicola lignicola CBS 123094 TaxID=1392246 RepID=A0A6A5WIK6_9PLEO|nr:hypothetical protein P154DRAFT_194515 [Amniculicola lignicola CBS 123094]